MRIRAVRDWKQRKNFWFNEDQSKKFTHGWGDETLYLTRHGNWVKSNGCTTLLIDSKEAVEWLITNGFNPLEIDPGLKNIVEELEK